MMNKIKFLMVIVIVLCAVNIGLMGIILFRQSSPPGRHGPPGIHPEDRPRHLIIQKLDFNEAQRVRYDSLIEMHRAGVRDLEDSIRIAKNRLYATLASVSPTGKDSLVSSLGLLQQQMELMHYRHFQDIKALCNPAQLRRFDELTKELAAYFRPERRK